MPLKTASSERLRKDLKSLVADFSYVCYTDLAIIIPSLVIIFLSTSFPWLKSVLADTRATPWGIVTSIYVHKDFGTHLLPIAENLIMISFLFVMTNFAVTKDVRRRRSKFFLYSVFVSAIIVNILWLFLSERPAAGSSGAGFASVGVLLGFAFANALPTGKTVTDLHQQYLHLRTGLITFLNLFVFVSIFLSIVYSPESFLGVGKDVNVFAHGIGFLLAFFGSFFYGYRNTFRKNKNILAEYSTAE